MNLFTINKQTNLSQIFSKQQHFYLSTRKTNITKLNKSLMKKPTTQFKNEILIVIT